MKVPSNWRVDIDVKTDCIEVVFGPCTGLNRKAGLK